jgi:hypothetical protein
MRWNKKPTPEIGSERTISIFLWLPIMIEGETRWLEFAKIRQVYSTYTFGWSNMEFIEECKS